MSLNGKKILAIVPAHNEEKTLPEVIAGLRDKAPFADVVVIDDSSTDGTLAWCQNNHVPVISTIYNLGIGGAMQAGYLYAYRNRYDIAVQVDGDGQHPPEYMERLLQPLFLNEADVVIGSRFLEKTAYQATLPRWVGIRLFSFITSLITHQKITDVTSGFRAANFRAIHFFTQNYPDDFPDAETLILLSFAGIRITEIPLLMHSRKHGVSTFNFAKSVTYFFKTFVSIFAALLSTNIQKEPHA